MSSEPPPPASSDSSRAPRVCLFTDTLADVNGVARFIRNLAERAGEAGRDLHVLTSQRLECPDRPNVHNIKPRFARPMPAYETLDIVIANAPALWRRADELQPDAVHLSTPGPVGIAGLRYARKRKLPILGTYHTDFPAYVDHLLDTDAATYVTRKTMHWFYKPFKRIFSRSADYADSLVASGIPRERLVRLLPGIRTETFHRRHRDTSIWHAEGGYGMSPTSKKLLYVGRVSVEKNLPFLVKVYKALQTRAQDEGVEVELAIVGDGPYRARMTEELAGVPVTFLGFRHGDELSRIYASSDVFVFPSTTDTLGQVVMESQSCAVPVVVTDQGGPSEVVDHDETGFVLSVENTALWVDHLMELLTDEGRRTRMGDTGFAKIQPMTFAHSFEHFWNVHVEVINEHRSSVGLPPLDAPTAPAS